MKWLHRPTWPDSPDTHQIYRTVVCEGVVVGSILKVNGGPRRGQWDWAALWPHASGSTDSMEAALTALREATARELERQPDLLNALQERHDKARASLNTWLAARGRHDEIKK